MALSPLPVVPRPLPDEHLSAWFARVAGVYSMTSLDLLDHVAAQAGRDSLSNALSHHPAPELLAVLAQSLDLPVQTLAGLTVPRLRPLWGKAFRTDCTVGPPPLHCPACLAGDEAAGRPHHLRVDWTCALAFHCPVHAIELLPGCPACRHTGLVFSGPPATARLHCALCHTRLGTRSAVSLARCHNPGRWPAADRWPSPDPQATHEPPFRAFMNAAMRALAWTPTGDGSGSSDCPAAFRSTLVGLLDVFGLPVRHDDSPSARPTLAHTFRLPWTRMVPSEWPSSATFATGFASLAGPTRFDLMVAVYALLSGADGLVSCRQWRLRQEDWRVYCMGDPIAQLLGAVDPEIGSTILSKTKRWFSTASRRFSDVQVAMSEKEVDLQEAVARRQGQVTLIPITQASLEERYFFCRKLRNLSDYSLLTIEDVLTVSDETMGNENNVTIEEMWGFSKARSTVREPDDAAVAPKSDPGSASNSSFWTSPLPAHPTGGSKVPAVATSPDLCLSAARAALSSEAGTQFKRSTSQQRRQAWFRLVKEANNQLKTLKAQGHPSRNGPI